MSKAIRDSAKGAPCLLRVPNVCQRYRDTVVHCHLRMNLVAGMGMKPNDLLGIRACFACHDWLDSRSGSQIHWEIRESIILAGLMRTLEALVDEGIVELP